MPAVTIQGCCFHRKQAGLWRKVCQIKCSMLSMLSLSGVRKWTKVHLAIYIALDIEVLTLFTTIKAQNLKKKKKN